MRRKTAWITTNRCTCKYKYGNFTVQPTETPTWMKALWTLVQTAIGNYNIEMPNSCNLNLYENVSDGISWHSDDETLFAGREKDTCIVSLSLGSTTAFQLCPVRSHENVTTIQLNAGDSLTMEGKCQGHYVHRLIPNSFRGQRINLTWRNIVNHECH